ncbi:MULTISPECIES: DNA cytosine methyltransferase [Aureimonas]|uniref:DNA (cytosine-5-)-methyltransferase n=1 Tax=Aureimonas pseudogalii TaxID=1744844 RepID=A0A7W6H706_9HYPH|nr:MULTISPECIES: DNA cytosine methyltransferase [Aureimonas]MBB3999692.1 site-specific DNA-cytosine methylase [Aureimonas pseudogalii]
MRTVELFCGAGGLSLGLGRAGCEVARAIDVWPEAVAVYRANLGDHAEVADIGDLLAVAPAVAALRPELICGGPPCQDFSAAGRRVEGERASLMVAFAMVVVVARPRWVLMENVPQAAKSAAWATARELLVRAGYGLSEAVVCASRYGVGQSRRRLIVVGRLGEADGFLASSIRAAASDRPTTIRDVLGGEVGEVVHAHPRHAGKRRLWSSDGPMPTIRESTRRPLPANADLSAADRALLALGALYVRPFGGGRGVRSVDEPCPAIVRTSAEPPGPRYLSAPHRDDIAPAGSVPCLTREQASRLQGFPAGWDWSAGGRLRNVDQMIANAVPSGLAEAIGRVIMARDRGETVPALEPGFSTWLRAKGVVGQTLRNRRTQLGRARRLLGGRILADLAAELAMLEAVEGFAKLSTGVRSDLRAALRLHAEWRAIPPTPRRTRSVMVADAVEERSDERAAA